MKTIKIVFFTLFIGLLVISCASTDKSASAKSDARKTSNTNSVDVDQPQLDLANYLRRVPGVSVNGDDVLIRSTTSAASDVTPLFVLDGVVIGNSFARAKDLVVVNDIKNVRVIKSGVDASMYGTQGTNGVIVITTKKKATD